MSFHRIFSNLGQLALLTLTELGVRRPGGARVARGVSLALGVRARDPARGFTRWQEHQGRRPIVPVVGLARHGDWCASHSGGGGGGGVSHARVTPRRRGGRDAHAGHGGDDGDDDGDDGDDDDGGTGSESTSRDDERLEEKLSTSDTTDDDDEEDDGWGGERRSDGRWGECG